jgi:hypothetical protein
MVQGKLVANQTPEGSIIMLNMRRDFEFLGPGPGCNSQCRRPTNYGESVTKEMSAQHG